MAAMMIDEGECVAADGARLQWHKIPIADIDLIARNTRGEEMGCVSQRRIATLLQKERRRPACLQRGYHGFRSLQDDRLLRIHHG